MKAISVIFIQALALGIVTQRVLSQDSIYLSNTAEPSAGNVGITTGAIWAQSFETGTNAGGYYLNSVTIDVGGATPTPPITPSIFGNFVNTSNPSLPSDYPEAGNDLGLAAGIDLAPSTIYWIWVTAVYAPQVGTPWYYSSNDSYVSQDNWQLSPTYLLESAAVQNSWSSEGSLPLQISIDATPIPEPEIFIPFGLGLAAILLKRRG